MAKKGAGKTIFTGLVSGVIGGAAVLGGYSLYDNQNNSSTSNTSNTDKSGNTTVSQVTYDVSSDTTKAVEKVQDAVVSVINLQTVQNNYDNIFGGMFGQEAEESSDEGELETSGEGSGVIYKIDGDYAYIVTNNHVVAGSDALQILLTDGTKLDAELVGADSYSDLAVLKIAADKVSTVAEFGDSDALTVGEPAIAIGSPLGTTYANSVTQGIISAKNRAITNTNDQNQTVSINAIQTDAAINPGNSGGPLVNIAGQVIGINSVKISGTSSASSTSVEGMGFAIPSNDVVSIINELEANGSVSRPMLGISMMNLSSVSTEQQETILKLPTDITGGVIVGQVQSGSPAGNAGLKKYDVITEMDGQEVTDSTTLQSILYSKKVGDTVDVTYYRDVEKNTAAITLDQKSSDLNLTTDSE